MGRKGDCLQSPGPEGSLKETKERANEGPSYLLNGPCPVQKRDEERASPENGRGGGSPSSRMRAHGISALMLAGGGTPRSLRCGTR